MTSLVKFLIWLAILGVILALVFYFCWVLTGQQALLYVPMNS